MVALMERDDLLTFFDEDQWRRLADWSNGFGAWVADLGVRPGLCAGSATTQDGTSLKWRLGGDRRLRLRYLVLSDAALAVTGLEERVVGLGTAPWQVRGLLESDARCQFDRLTASLGGLP